MTDDPIANAKLLAAKQKWARDGRLLTGAIADPAQRLPPGQRLTEDWPVLDLGQQPDISAQSFYLDILGLVANAQHMRLAELMRLGEDEMVSDMHCVTQWSRYDNTWHGVPARALLDLVQPGPEVRHVLFTARDGYTTNVRLDQFDQPDVLLASTWQGAPITREHGGPVRVVIPRLYLWKSPKWVCKIEFSATDRPGYWERNGYSNNADPWLEERYS